MTVDLSKAKAGDVALKPCPFCGANACEDEVAYGQFINVCCSNEECDLSSVAMTRFTWNTRATELDVVECVMAVDLSNAKTGDTVYFRCGGYAVISKKCASNIYIEDCGTWYSVDGKYGGSPTHRIFDIIRIEPKPFDWGEVQNGMAFVWMQEKYECRGHFVGINPQTKDIVCSFGTAIKVFSNKNDLTRSPAYDIPERK